MTPPQDGAPDPDLPDPDAPEPGVDHPREQVTWQFVRQARACAVMGSPMYAALLTEAARDVAHGGICWSLTRPHVAPGRGNAIALRLMASVHRLVLSGRSPDLAPHVPSVGGHFDPGTTWPAFHAVLEHQRDAVETFLALPCQTNESGRAAALAVGILGIAKWTGLPVALREIGTAAGLNLRLDRFRYTGGGQAWGPEDSPVDLSGHWVDVPPIDDAELHVVERRGLDRSPIDPTTADGRLALSSSIWADQQQRFQRLLGAIELAEQVPAQIETGDATDWVEDTFAAVAGQVTVLMHSVLEEYLAPSDRDRLHRAVRAAAAQASAAAPVAWLRLEPVSAVRRHGLTLTLWPDGTERLLATSSAMGGDVRRPERTGS